MILFYNWENLVKESKGSPISLLSILKQYKEKPELLKGRASKLIGHSFLINPEKLFTDKTTDILYIYQYILLSAKRDYALYIMYGIKTLPLAYFKDINLGSIRTNPLLIITKTDIHFKYEE
jgi:hypothetical protein